MDALRKSEIVEIRNIIGNRKLGNRKLDCIGIFTNAKNASCLSHHHNRLLQSETTKNDFHVILIQNPDAWGLMGHLYYLTSRTEEARDCYERTLAYTTEAADMHAIYLRLASIYLEKGEVRLCY